MKNINHIIKIKFHFFIYSIFILFISCSESLPIDTTGETKIYNIDNNNTFYSDTILIYGEYLGQPDSSNYVVFNDTLKILSFDCIQWTESKISIRIPKLSGEATLYVVINNKKIEVAPKTYYINLNISPLPPFKIVKIDAGSFNMGSNFGFLDELPIHNVNINHSFLVSTTEISQRIYSLTMDTNTALVIDDDLPIYNISWLEAIKFCNRISEFYNLKPAYIITQDNYVAWDTLANGWRLPTEAEWEFCAQMDPTANINEYAWYSSNSGLTPKPCGLLKPNNNGLYDCIGNVAEWCWDYYDANYYNISPTINPKGSLTGTTRVNRGSCCIDGKANIRVQKRNSQSTNTFIGIRLVRNI